ncbi:MAG: potassium channel family protein [Acutalibacteraceae bacterium]
MKSFLVIGMGRFGSKLAKKLLQLDNDVMVVDKSEEKISSVINDFTDAQIGDCTNPAVLESLGVNNFDACFVTIGDNFQSSLEITSLLKDMDAKYVISKANSEIQRKFLLRNGADEVVYPIKEIAEKLAIRTSANNLFDYVEISSDFSISEIAVHESWIGKSIANIDVRKKHHVNILAIKKDGELMPMPGADYVFERNDHVVILAKSADIFKLSSKI